MKKKENTVLWSAKTCACGKDVLHCNTAVTRGQHVACFPQRQRVTIYPFVLGKEKIIKDGLTEFMMYANLRLAVAPAICTLALLAEFLPVTPTSKTQFENFNDQLFHPEHIANSITLVIIKLFILPERMGE